MRDGSLRAVHCLLETVELERALGWDPESSWVGRGEPKALETPSWPSQNSSSLLTSHPAAPPTPRPVKGMELVSQDSLPPSSYIAKSYPIG